MASGNGTWHSATTMPAPDSPPNAPGPRGAGGPIVLILIAGVVIGVAAGQPTIGFLAGLGVAIAVAILLWVSDRGR